MSPSDRAKADDGHTKITERLATHFLSRKRAQQPVASSPRQLPCRFPRRFGALGRLYLCSRAYPCNTAAAGSLGQNHPFFPKPIHFPQVGIDIYVGQLALPHAMIGAIRWPYVLVGRRNGLNDDHDICLAWRQIAWYVKVNRPIWADCGS